MTRVVHIREPYDTYVGRTTPFGNPYRIGPDGTRDEVIAKFRSYFYEKLRADHHFAQRVYALRGKVLGCHCAPNPCHGQVIAEWIESVAAQQTPGSETQR